MTMPGILSVINAVNAPAQDWLIVYVANFASNREYVSQLAISVYGNCYLRCRAHGKWCEWKTL